MITNISTLRAGDEFRFLGTHFVRIFEKQTNKGYHFRFKEENLHGMTFCPDDREVEFTHLELRRK